MWSHRNLELWAKFHNRYIALFCEVRLPLLSNRLPYLNNWTLCVWGLLGQSESLFASNKKLSLKRYCSLIYRYNWWIPFLACIWHIEGLCSNRFAEQQVHLWQLHEIDRLTSLNLCLILKAKCLELGLSLEIIIPYFFQQIWFNKPKNNIREQLRLS